MQNFGPLPIEDIPGQVHHLELELRAMKAQLAQALVGGKVNIATAGPTGVLSPLLGGTGHALLGSPLGVTVWLSPASGSRGTVVVTTTTDRTYGTSTTQGDTNVIGVLDDAPSGAGENVRVRHIGYQPVVRCAGAVTAGHFLRQSVSAGLAEDAGTSVVAGAFGIAMTTIGGAGNVAAWIFPPEYAASGSGYNTVEDEGVGLTQRSTINFTGAGVTASDSGGKTVVNIPSGGGAPTDYAYLGFGTHASLSAEVNAYGLILQNEVKAWPPLVQIGAGFDLVTQNQWWDDEGTPTTKATAVPVSGEAGLDAKFTEVIKCVTDAADEGFNQRYTYADEPRIKSGKTISALVWVASTAGSVDCTVKLRNSDATETTGTLVATDGDWDLYAVEGHACAGTYVELVVTKDTSGTFYAGGPITVSLGPKAIALPPRALLDRFIDPVSVKSYDGLGDEATWTDIDVTSNSSPLAALAYLGGFLADNTSGDRFDLYLRRNGSSDANDDNSLFDSARMNVSSIDAGIIINHFAFILDDQQIFEYYLDRVAGAGTLLAGRTTLYGWREWA